MVLIRLASRARQTLRHILRSNADAHEVRRAQILLWLDGHESARAVAQRVGRTRQAIYALVHRYQARRALPVAERIRDQPRQGRPATKRERTLQVLRTLLAQPPSRYHYRSPVWTVPMTFGHTHPSTATFEVLREYAHGASRPSSVTLSVQAPALCLRSTPGHLAPSKRGLKKGLKGRRRTVILFLDSTIFSEVPPLRAIWAPIGQQARVPILGTHDRRFLTGVMSIKTGDYIDSTSAEFHQEHFQELLRRIRRHWRGWQIVLFLDRNSPHRTPASRQLARDLGIQLRWLPKACSELNVMDTLWRKVKDNVAANEPTPNVDETVCHAQSYVHSLSPTERLQKAGILSKEFWLADVLM
jgi:transposase